MRTHTVIGFGEQTRCTPVTERGDASVHWCDCCERIATGLLGSIAAATKGGQTRRWPMAYTPVLRPRLPPPRQTPANNIMWVGDAVVVYYIPNVQVFGNLYNVPKHILHNIIYTLYLYYNIMYNRWGTTLRMCIMHNIEYIYHVPDLPMLAIII